MFKCFGILLKYEECISKHQLNSEVLWCHECIKYLSNVNNQRCFPKIRRMVFPIVAAEKAFLNYENSITQERLKSLTLLKIHQDILLNIISVIIK